MNRKHLNSELLQLTKELIRIRSTDTYPEKICECADFIENWLAKESIIYERHNNNGVPSLVVLPSPSTESGTKVLFMTHFDVVEAEDESLFSPRVKNGKLYGRGAIDDKYGVALSLLLFRERLTALQKKGLSQKDMRFGLLLTGDEEVGGANGAGAVCNNLSTDFFLALDGGNPDLIVIKEKGVIRLELEAVGKATHAARPWLGKNAFDLLVNDYIAVKSLFSETRPDHWHKTVSLTRCRAGNGSVNMVPGRATAILDIRYTEDDNPQHIITSIQRVVTSKITVLDKIEVFFGGESPLFPLLQEHSGGARFGFEHGASDAGYLSTRNIPGAIWGADGELSQHTEEEHLVLDSFYSLFERLNNFIQEIEEQ